MDDPQLQGRFDELKKSLQPSAGGRSRPPEPIVPLNAAHAAQVRDCVETLVKDHPLFYSGDAAPFSLPLPSPAHIQGGQRRQRLRDLQIRARLQLLKNTKDSYAHCKPMQRRISIEERQITLAALQSKVRGDVWKARSAALPIRSELRRAGSSSDHARLSDKLYDRLQVDKAQLKRVEHWQLLQEVMRHQEKFKDMQAARKKEKAKLLKSINAHHKDRERQRLREQDKLRRDRLKALRDNDEEAYLKLIQNTKNDRITQLLSQTEEYLAQLGSKVQLERDRVEKFKSNEELAADRAAAAKQTEGGVEAEGEGENKEVNQYIKQKKQYYKGAHRIQEKITKQPSCLVGGDLKPYQVEGLEWMVSLYNNGLNGILADEMGLGKTIQTIALISHLVEVKRNSGPYLIVVPLSTLANWELEFEKWAPSLTAVAYRGTKEHLKRLERTRLADPNGFHCILTTFEMVMRSSYLRKTQLQYIIVDEGHRLKNADCKLFRTLTSCTCRHRLLLTGTPLQNSLDELWALLNFLLPHIFSSADTFSEWFNSPFEEQGGGATGDRMEMEEEEMLLVINRLHQVLRPFVLRREKKDVEMQLPEKKEHVLRCAISAWQQVVYEQLQNQALRSVDPSTGKLKTSLMNNTVVQLRKVCNHPFLVCDEYEYTDEELLRSSGKFDLLDRMLHKLIKTGHKVLIFSQMTKLLDLLEDFLNMRDLSYLRLDGSTKPEDRGQIVARFNEKEGTDHVFLLSTRAGGLGLNLQQADTVILYDSDWNPQQDLQAMDRAHRIGQASEVRVYRFVTATRMEENMYARAMRKLDIDAKVIQAGKFNNSASDEDRQSHLANLLRDGVDTCDDSAVPSYAQLNRLICRSDEEFEMFQKMDRDAHEARAAAWREEGNEGPVPPLLMTKEELPEFLTAPVEEEVVETQVELGKRKRTAVTYDDGLSDKQFDKLLESGIIDSKTDTPLDAEGLKALNDERRKSKSKRSKKAKRDEMDDLPDTEPPEWYKDAIKIFDAVYNAKDDSGRHVRQWFEKLPSRDKEPHYYRTIASPMDMRHINKSIKKQFYTQPSEFIQDIRLLYTNAQSYNVEGSEVHKDADVIAKVVEAKVKEVMPEFAHDATEPEPDK